MHLETRKKISIAAARHDQKPTEKIYLRDVREINRIILKRHRRIRNWIIDPLSIIATLPLIVLFYTIVLVRLVFRRRSW